MSEFINNSNVRQEQLKDIIKQIHNGLPLDQAKAIFKEQFESVSTEEITSMEHTLIEEGMSIEEVQKLCDVHAAVFDGSISDIHKAKDITEMKGHPAKIFKDENTRIQEVLNDEVKPFIGKFDRSSHLMLRIGLERLSEISKHYSKKENLFFPGLEKRGVTSIPKVMWGVDNEIRETIKKTLQELGSIENNLESIQEDLNTIVNRVEDMIVKENNILLPLLSDTLSLYDWILADEGSPEIGYFLDTKVDSWKKENKVEEIVPNQETNNNEIQFSAGTLLPNEINAILNTVPFDMTYIDKDGHVKYFTQGKERIFDRPKTIIGRHVNMCHPPQSVHVVDEIVNSFKSGEKDHEDFWIDFKKMFVHIRYYAIRDINGEYLGTLEVTQDIKPIRDLVGEKRLVEK